MKELSREKREKKRYPKQMDMGFSFAYDMKTKVKFQRLNQGQEKDLINKIYSATSRNVSADGLCFVSDQKFERGATLHLEVYVPTSDNAVNMEGRVRWSKDVIPKEPQKKIFDTGVYLTSVEGQKVKDTVYYDDEYHVVWSPVLELILGTFRKIAQGETSVRELSED